MRYFSKGLTNLGRKEKLSRGSMNKLLTLALVATTASAANTDHVLVFSLNSGQSEKAIGDKGVRPYCASTSPPSPTGERLAPTPRSPIPFNAMPKAWVFLPYPPSSAHLPPTSTRGACGSPHPRLPHSHTHHVALLSRPPPQVNSDYWLGKMQKQIHSLITTTLKANPKTDVFCFSDQELKGESGTPRAHAMGEVGANHRGGLVRQDAVDVPGHVSPFAALDAYMHVAATTEQYCGTLANGWKWIDDKKVRYCFYRVRALPPLHKSLR